MVNVNKSLYKSDDNGITMRSCCNGHSVVLCV